MNIKFYLGAFLIGGAILTLGLFLNNGSFKKSAVSDKTETFSKEVKDKYSFSRNTFSYVPKDDDKDRITVEIGDSKKDDFYPQVKIKRWDDEVNLSFKLKDNQVDPESLSTDNDKIIWSKGTKEVHLYDLPASQQLPEGGYEFEVILKEKPANNKVEFALNTKGVDFFYQPPLNEENTDPNLSCTQTTCTDKDGIETNFRPENVVGSYAVYTSENKVNYVGGKEYKTGKIGHIYRPRIIDANNTEVWGDLHIENGILSVTIPQEFLDKAVYPVRHAAGMTFGYTSNGASTGTYGTVTMVGSVFTLSSDGTGNSVSVYSGNNMTYPNNYYNNKALVVLHSNLNIIANGITNSSGAESTNVKTWYTMTLAGSPSLSASTDYVLMWVNDGWPSQTIGYDAGSANQGHVDTSNNFNTPTNPTDAAHNNNQYSIYATYTASSTPTPAAGGANIGPGVNINQGTSITTN